MLEKASRDKDHFECGYGLQARVWHEIKDAALPIKEIYLFLGGYNRPHPIVTSEIVRRLEQPDYNAKVDTYMEEFVQDTSQHRFTMDDWFTNRPNQQRFAKRLERLTKTSDPKRKRQLFLQLLIEKADDNHTGLVYGGMLFGED